MAIWAIANQKGGVGKTTTAVTLAGWLMKQRFNVLLLDTDPHGSLSTYFGINPDRNDRSIFDLFCNRDLLPSEAIQATKFKNIDLIPASPALATLDRQMSSQEGMGLILGKAINKIDRPYDHIVIDCPPVLGVLMVNALAACDRLLIPVQTEFLALKGLEKMMRTLTMINKAKKISIPFTIIPTMFDRRTRASLQSLTQLEQQYGAELWSTPIPIDTQFREASQNGIPLPIMAPLSRGSIAYGQLFENLLSTNDSVEELAAI